MKLTNQLTAVIIVAIAALVAMVYLLSSAGWSEAGIAGMVTGIATAVGALIVSIRNQGKQNETLERQDATLAKIEHQTNSLSDEERQEIADRAAVAVVDAWRKGLLR